MEISETTLKKYFCTVYGCGYKEYQTSLRMKLAAFLLETTANKIIEIAEAVRHSNQAKFSAIFKKYFGNTPTEFRRSANFKSTINEKD